MATLLTSSPRVRRAYRKASRDEELESSCAERFIKTLFALSRTGSQGRGFRRPAVPFAVHAGARDGIDYGGGAMHEVAKPRLVLCVCSARSARLYIARLGKNPNGYNMGQTFRSVIVAHDPGASQTDYL